MNAGPVRVAWGAATDVGLRRSLNEDSHLAAPPFFLVADGMGGHQAGEIASATVIEHFSHFAGRPSVPVEAVRETLQEARRRVDTLPQGAGAGAGTTLAGVALTEVDGAGHWLVVNVGDSRTYRLRGGVFEQMSVDHSLVQELIDAGQLDEATAAQDSRRNVITRALGAGSDGEPDYRLLPADEGDRILVCSDGLPNELDPIRIQRVLRAEADPQAAADRLVREAVAAGGRDNVTVLVIDALAVRDDDLSDTLPSPRWEELREDTLPRAHAV